MTLRAGAAAEWLRRGQRAEGALCHRAGALAVPVAAEIKNQSGGTQTALSNWTS